MENIDHLEREWEDAQAALRDAATNPKTVSDTALHTECWKRCEAVKARLDAARAAEA